MRRRCHAPKNARRSSIPSRILRKTQDAPCASAPTRRKQWASIPNRNRRTLHAPALPPVENSERVVDSKRSTGQRTFFCGKSDDSGSVRKTTLGPFLGRDPECRRDGLEDYFEVNPVYLLLEIDDFGRVRRITVQAAWVESGRDAKCRPRGLEDYFKGNRVFFLLEINIF